MAEVIMAYTVDRSWGRYTGNSEGELIRQTKWHRNQRNDCLAACTRHILLNMEDATPASELDRDDLCRRCFPTDDQERSPR